MGNTDTTHQEWLAQLEEESRLKQEKFIRGISERLGRPRPVQPPNHPYRGAPGFWRDFQWDTETRVERFMENFTAVAGEAIRLKDMAEVQRFLTSRALEMSAKQILIQNQPELLDLGLESALPDAQVSAWNTDPDESWKSRAAEADFGIVLADYAVAYTASIVVQSSGDKGRSVSLLPTALIAIIPIERLRTRLGEVLTEFDQAGREGLPAGIHFISGPSRSSDIENELTIGVHGPGIAMALLVG